MNYDDRILGDFLFPSLTSLQLKLIYTYYVVSSIII